MKAKIFYHGSDIDGYSSGYIAKKYISNNYSTHEIEMIPVNYDDGALESIKDLCANDIVIIADYSLTMRSKDIVDYIVDNNINVIWCDHHKSSIDFINEYPKADQISGIRSADHSGVYLLYMRLYYKDNYDNVVIPRWIQLVSDYDTFTLKFKESKPFNYGTINSGRWDPRNDDNIWKDLDDTSIELDNPVLNTVILEGNMILRYLTNDNERYLKANGFECTLNDVKCIACNKMSNSLLFGKYYDEYPIVSTFVFTGEKYRYSIYARHDSPVDCSKIAESYGGGGHKGAAGFTADRIVYENIQKLK